MITSVAKVKRQNIEQVWLEAFVAKLTALGIEAAGRGQGADNLFHAGFELVGKQQFQYGDLRAACKDRIVIVEVESGGGLTNLVKYWPLAATAQLPILLLHVFGQGSANDYVSHLRLWEFVWQKMRTELWQLPAPILFARQFRFAKTDPAGLDEAAAAFHKCLTVEPLADVLREVFGFNPS